MIQFLDRLEKLEALIPRSRREQIIRVVYVNRGDEKPKSRIEYLQSEDDEP
jgi:hypothetical protein